MKTVNVRQSRKDFVDEYMRSVHNAYFKALAKAFELTAGKRWDSINYTYDNNGLTYLSVFNDAGDEDIIYSSKNKNNKQDKI